MYILYNVILITLIIYFYKKTKNAIHMLQLESYKNERYFKWIKNNKKKVFQKKEILFLFPIILYFINNLYGVIFLIIINLFLIFTYKKEKQKKPLVVTNRVKRLYMTYFILTIMQFVILNLLEAKECVILFNLLITILAYFIVILINVINSPIEKNIQRGFYNKAKNKLENMPNLKVIGITGSFGKTSTKYILSTILMQKYDVLMTPESYNTTLGVVRTINEKMKSTNQIFVCEMGAKNIGDIKEICDLVKPTYGLVTSIGKQHLETFKNIENVKKTKMELIDALPEDGIGFLNYDDDNIVSCKTNKNILKYGLNNKENDIWAENIEIDEKGSSFTICFKDGKKIDVRTKLLGQHNILNILGASLVAYKLGLSDNEIKLGIKLLKAVPHRLEMKVTVNGNIIIDDAYNSNVKGAEMALDVLGLFKDRKKVLITPGIVDLGESAYEINKNLGKQAVQSSDFIILVGEKAAKPIYDGIKETTFNLEKVYIAKDLDDALNKMNSLLIEKSVILFENDLPDNYL